MHLTKPREDQHAYKDIRFNPTLPDQKLKTITVFKQDKKYYAAVPVERTNCTLLKTGKDDAIDVNVSHFNENFPKIP